MNAMVQGELELSAVLNLVPYLDTNFHYDCEMSLADIVAANASKFKNDETFQILKKAIEQNPSYGEIVLVDQSSTNSTGAWKDDLIQGCTFRDADGNYYVAFRGTGDGRWADNGNGMTVPTTEMQEAAANYFDEMAEKYLIDASMGGKKITVTGHSKGGNEAQYVFMAAKHEEIIDNCYSFDGQGFSGSAIENFQEAHGENYNEKLEHMYSICGENDFVHDLGYVIIPEENTYFVETTGSGFASLHALENMIGDGSDEYTGLNWDIVDGQITHGEQGEIGALAKKISEAMMKLDDEDLNGAAIAVMSIIDPYSNDDILGSIFIKPSDYVDLAAHGLPVAIATLLSTPEGHAVLEELLQTAADHLYENYGPGGLVGGFAIGGLLLATVVVPLLIDVVVIANLLDIAIDKIHKIIEAYEKLKKFVTTVKEAIVETVNKIANKLRSLTSEYRYATENPRITVDTYKLRLYAQKLTGINRRISKLDGRMDSLYWDVGVKDLGKLIKADALTGYSWRLNRCADYLNDTADDFEKIERKLINHLA